MVDSSNGAGASTTPIAIVGLSCRFPGDATSPERLWQLCAEGRSAWSKIPEDRFNQDAFYHPVSENRPGMNVKGAHFLKQDLALFDAAFFNMTAEMAATMDPQLRMQMESVFEAIENAGYPLVSIAGSNTSVYAGAFLHDYQDTQLRDPQTLPRYVMTGNGHTMLSNRISHFFDLRGPSLTVDTACSTGLVALHQACQSLKTGESDMSIVAAANVMLNPDIFVLFSSLGFLSPDGKCYSFDKRANGYGRGEGVSAIVLKPLDAALRDGDPVRAVIRQTALNQDGKTATITSPSQDAQEELIRTCYRSVGLRPSETGYVEAHGTGTNTGDPIEANALGKVFSEGRSADKPAILGSVKSNIGHLETTSGLAAIVKVVLALERELVPPSGNFESPNGKIDLNSLKLRIPAKLEAWPQGLAKRASINNFGYGGTNAHVIIEQFESYRATREASERNGVRTPQGSTNGASANAVKPNGTTHNGILGNGTSTNGAFTDVTNKFSISGDSNTEVAGRQIFVLSGKDEVSARSMLRDLDDYLDKFSGDQSALLCDLAYTLDKRRSRFQWLSAVTAQSTSGLREALRATKPTRSIGVPRVGLVFTGQGAQWYGMGRELMRTYAAFRASIQQSDDDLRNLGAPWSLAEELLKDEEYSKVNDIGFSPMLCIAVQMALTDTLRSWGVKPHAITSHSSGEVAAAYAAGAISARDAMTVVWLRTPFLRVLQEKQGSERGAMIAVGLGKDEAESYISALKSGRAVIACVNSPASVTVSGDLPAVEELEKLLQTEKVFARKLKINVAFHSHHMSTFSKQYLAGLQQTLGNCKRFDDVLFYSPVTGKQVCEAADLGPEHWLTNTVSPVLFQDSLTAMCTKDKQKEVDVLIEVGPHGALAGPIRQIMTLPELKESGISYASCLERGKDAVETLQAAACHLFKNGYPIDLKAVNNPSQQTPVRVLSDLPSYPWNHQTRYWVESPLNKQHRLKEHGVHDLLGQRMTGTNKKAPTWRHIIRQTDVPWLRDHVVQSNVVYPGAGYISMVIEAMRQTASREKRILGFKFRDVDISAALTIPDSSDGREVHLSLNPCSDKTLEPGWMEFFVRSADETDAWTDHCKGRALTQFEGQEASAHTDHEAVDLELLIQPDQTYSDGHDPEETFKTLRKVGLNHGPLFQNLLSAKLGDGRSVTIHRIPDTAAVMPGKFQRDHLIHPTTLDSLLVGAYTSLPYGGSKDFTARVPRAIDSIWIANDLPSDAGTQLKSYNLLERHSKQGLKTSVAILNANNTAQLQINGLSWQTIGSGETNDEDHEQALSIHWEQSLTNVDLRALQQSLQFKHDDSLLASETRLQLAVLTFIADALKSLTETDVKKLSWYHKLYYNWMKVHRQRGEQILKQANLSQSERLKLYDTVSEESVDGKLAVKVGKHLLEILRAETAPLNLMMEDQLLFQYYEGFARIGNSYKQVCKLVDLFAHENPCGRVLEIGGGTGGCTKGVLNTLGGNRGPARFVQYDFTDISSGFFDQAKVTFADWEDLVNFKKLDIEADLEEQGFEDGTYDLIIACQVLHATRSMNTTMSNVQRLLKPGGKLIMVETTNDSLDISLVFGTLPGWWMSEEDERELSPSLSLDMWHRILLETGFNGLDLQVQDCDDPENHVISVIMASKTTDHVAEYHENVLICYLGEEPPKHWVEGLKNDLQVTTDSSVDFAPLAEAQFDGKVCIYIDDVENPVLANPTADQFELIKKLTIRAKGVLWVSSGGTRESARPFAGVHTGFLRNLSVENRMKRYVSLDFDTADLWRSETRGFILQVYGKAFDLSLETGSIDCEYAISKGEVMIPRLLHNPNQTAVLSGYAQGASTETQPIIQSGRDLQMFVENPGIIDSLCFRDDPDAGNPLEEGWVEIETRAFGLNFRDVMVALGQLDNAVMGCECSGVVRRVGKNVIGYKIGDRVYSLLRGHWGTSVRVHQSSLGLIPRDMSFEVAASIPTIFATAYYGLIIIGKLQDHDRVLIHAAAGGVGQAAIMIARNFDAEIFVTVGSPEKRDFIHDTYGIPYDHILGSRDPSFAIKVKRMTNGAGVDIVINSLAGPLLKATWDCLAMFGRFIEIGKRDIENNNNLGMAPFAKNVIFASVDLLLVGEHQPAITAKIMQSLAGLLKEKKIRPIDSLTTYNITDVKKAYRFMQSGKHLGKIVVTIGKDDMVEVSTQRLARLTPNASYLIIGGTGAIGRSIARRMIKLGAKNLVLVSRNAEAKSNSALLRQLESLGCRVVARSCDIGDAADVKRMVKELSASMPPIKGLIQGAMVLQDSIFESMTHEQYRAAAVTPKIAGTWNLHALLPDDLEFFITLSSVMAITGNPSQANYVAGNAFKDALIRHRTSKGLPGVSLNLSLIMSVGSVSSDQAITQNLAKFGWSQLEEEAMLQLIEAAIADPRRSLEGCQVGSGLTRATEKNWKDARWRDHPMFSTLKAAVHTSSSPAAVKDTGIDLKRLLSSAETFADATEAVLLTISKKLSDMFSIPEDEVDRSANLAKFGVDSLVAIELRNWLSSASKAEISIFEMMQSPNIVALSDNTVKKSKYVQKHVLEAAQQLRS